MSHLLLATKSDVHLVHLVSDPPSCRIHEQIIMDGGRGQGMMIGLLDTFKVKGDERREEKKKPQMLLRGEPTKMGSNDAKRCSDTKGP